MLVVGGGATHSHVQQRVGTHEQQCQAGHVTDCRGHMMQSQEQQSAQWSNSYMYARNEVSFSNVTVYLMRCVCVCVCACVTDYIIEGRAATPKIPVQDCTILSI